MSATAASKSSSSSSNPPVFSVREAEEKVKDAMQCPICTHTYDLHTHIPQLVHLSHTICSSCIDTLGGLLSPPQVRCPLCNIDVLLTARLSNTVVCDLIEALTTALTLKEDPEDEGKQERKGDKSAEDSDAAEEKDDANTNSSTASETRKKKKKKRKRSKKKTIVAAHSPPRAPGEAPRDVFTPSSPSLVCLTNRDLFPSYDCLPSAQKLNEDWYTRKGQVRCPKVNWCFVGEVCRCEKFIRFGVHVMDRDRKEVPIYFYCEPFNTSQFRVGSTVLVRYAERYQFLDGRWGLRVDNAEFVKVLPLGLTNLTLFDQGRAEKADNDRAHGRHCQRCNTAPAAVTCPDCKVVDYCTEQCRSSSGAGHRETCQLWQALEDVHHLPHGAHANDVPGSAGGQPIKLVMPFQHSVVGLRRQ